MASFTSILDPRAGSIIGTDTPPDCFADLYLDQVIGAVTAGYGGSDLARIFYAPQRQPSVVEYRQQVFRDLEDDETRAPVQNFVDGMRTVRSRLHVARNAWHRLQKQGWLVAAIETYCHAVALLGDGLTYVQPRSRGCVTSPTT